MPETLADVLDEYVKRSRYSRGQLAALSGLPKRTIANWLEGLVKKPQRWQGLAELAAVLHLDEGETSRLLQVAGHRSVAELQEMVTEAEDVVLLAPWPKEAAPPFQAIADLSYFVGREGALQELAEALLQGKYVNICNLRGMGGVGKTVLAARLAYQLRPHFPDGVLWARLDTSDTMAILSTFAKTYGHDVSQQTDLASRSSFVRGILANKRALMVLDDAQNSQQVRPLLPPTTGKPAVIITTRHDLTIADGFKRFEVEPFNPESGNSLRLLARFLGQPYIRQHQASLTEISDLLGHLPLAIAIAAARLAYTPGQTVADFLSQIRHQEGRLDQLAREDRGVRLSFDLSYHALSPDLQQFFAALGAFGGADFGLAGVAAVTEVTVETAANRLRELARLSLVRPETKDRYTLHPLLQTYAREKIAQDAVFERLVAFYVDYVIQHEFNYEALDLETSNILATLQTGFEQNLTDTLIQGVNAFYTYLEMRGLHDLAEHHLKQALQVATSSQDARGAALILTNFGHLEHKRGDYPQAEAHLQAGLTLARQVEDPQIVSRLLHRLAALIIEQGDYAQAEAYLLAALPLARQIGDDKILCDVLSLLGKVVAHSRGDYDQVEAYLQESYNLARQIGDRNRLGDSLMRLGALAYERGQWEQAKAFFQEGLTLARTIGDLEGELRQLHNLGIVAQGQGDYEQAEFYLQAGLTLAEKIDLREMMALTLTSLGEVAFEQGEFVESERHYQQALTIAREINHPANLSYVLANLGAVATKRGDYDDAEVYLQEGWDLAGETGQPWDMYTVLTCWGELHLEQGQLDAAETALKQAMGIAQEAGIEELVGEALYKSARIKAAQGNLTEASRLGQGSLAILKKLGHHWQAEVESWLANLPGRE